VTALVNCAGWPHSDPKSVKIPRTYLTIMYFKCWVPQKSSKQTMGAKM